MSNRDLIIFDKRIENWELSHPRQWVATADRSNVANFISGQTDKVVSAQLKAADRVIVSQDRIASGIDKVAFGIDKITDGLESLASAFEWGFTELVWQFEQQRFVLENILRVLQAPLDSQAKELRKRAENAYKNGWFDDALEDFLESEKKNRYDFTVHQYLGNIYFFEKKNPEKALEYYEKAVKYAKPESPYYASLSLLHIGLIKYLHGDYSKACEATYEAIELSPNLYEAHYQNAQYLANLGLYNDAIKHLRKAIEGDRYYCVKADTEEDFNAMKKQLRLLFKELQNKAKSQANSEVEKAIELIKDAEYYGISNNNSDKFRVAKNKLKEAAIFISRDSLFDCWDATYKACVAKKMVVDSSIEYLHNQISKTQSEYSNKKGECRTEAEGWFVLWIGVFVLSMLPIISYILTNSIWSTILIVIIAFIIGSVVATILDAIFDDLIYTFYLKKYKKKYENKLDIFKDELLETQEKKSRLGIDENAINIEDADQYENFLRKKYG